MAPEKWIKRKSIQERRYSNGDSTGGCRVSASGGQNMKNGFIY